MIIYFAAQIMAWMYGYAWPLENHGARNCLAAFSTIEMIVVVVMLGPLAAAFVVEWVKDALTSKRNKS